MDDPSTSLIPMYDPLNGSIDIPMQSDITIPAHSDARVDMGVYLQMPPETAGFVASKSGTIWKDGMLVLHSTFFGKTFFYQFF
jgi:dUTPase